MPHGHVQNFTKSKQIFVNMGPGHRRFALECGNNLTRLATSSGLLYIGCAFQLSKHGGGMANRAEGRRKGSGPGNEK